MTTLAIESPTKPRSPFPSGPNEATAEVRIAAAMKLYELGRLSSGTAVALPRVAFVARLTDHHVPTFRLTDAELTSDVRDSYRASHL